MQFRILGPLEVDDDGRTLELGGARQRALLGILLLHRGEAVPADRLIEDLYGGHPPASAATSLKVHVSRLRKALGPNGSLSTRGGGYALDLGEDQFDGDRFERLLAAGRRALAEGDPEAASGALAAGLALWRGSPLADWAYEEFAQSEILRLEELRAGCFEEWIEAELALGHHADLVGELEQRVAQNPLRERPRAQLMLALYRSGRQAEALAAYQEGRRVLVEELGIEPGRALRELEQAILRQDTALDCNPSAALDGDSNDATGQGFVGRSAELQELSAGLEDALAGRGRLFLLAGEPGIGKSRLTEELTRQARARRARVLVGRCWEAGGAPAYWPWVQSLRGYIREVEPDVLRAQLGGGAGEVAQILPELRDLLPGLPEPASLDSEAARFRLFEATAVLIRNASEDRALVIVLDDLHAADTPSLLLLQFLAREIRSARVLFLVAFRDVDPIPDTQLTAFLAEVTREPLARRLTVRGLREEDVAKYVELTAAQIATPQLATALYEATEGNPLFVAETVRLLSLEGTRPGSGDPGRVEIPQSVRDVISRRLGRLPAECRRVLVLASVLGREFVPEVLARLTGLSEDELLETLEEGIAARVIADIPGGTARMRFAHVLIRDTLYEGLATARRLHLHRSAVAALEEFYGEESGPHLAELAYHSFAGRSFEQGLRYAVWAGQRAHVLLAYEEAARLYQMALAALEHVGPHDDERRCELLLALGETQSAAGDVPAAKEIFLEAADLGRRLGLKDQLARAAAGYGGRNPWARAGDDDRLVPLLEEGLAALADADAELRSRLLARLAGALRDEHSRDRRDALSMEAVELARRSTSPVALLYALDARMAAIFAPDTVAACLELSGELCDVAEQIGDTERCVAGHWNRFMVHTMRGDVEAGRRELSIVLPLVDALRLPAEFYNLRAAEASFALEAGRLDDAEELMSEARDLGSRALPEMVMPTFVIQQYTLRGFQRRLDEVEPALQALIATYPARPVFRCALTCLQAELGRTAEAWSDLGELTAGEVSSLPFDQEWLFGMSLLAEACALVEHVAAAETLYDRLLPWAGFNAVDFPEALRGSISRYVGLLAATLGRWDEASVHFENAIAVNSRMGARPWLAHTQRDLARALVACGAPGDPERSRQLLVAAHQAYSDLGMHAYAATVAAD